MALFTDGPLSDGADLQRYENDILNVTSVEGIDLGGKLRLAQEQLSQEVIRFLLRRRTYANWPLEVERARDVNDVVVTQPMRQWHVHTTLALIYRDAYDNQLNDRYQGKWREYEKLAKASETTCFQIGIGLVADPVPKAPPPTIATITGPGSGATYYVAVTWVNASGQEGAPSDFSELSTSDGQELVVAVSGAPLNVTGWNVYVGVSPGTGTLQNQSPLVTTANWTMTSELSAGAPLPQGQRPSWFVVDHRAIQRG